MSTAQFKFLTWTVSSMLGIGMSLYVGSFLARKTEIEQPVDRERMKRILDNVPEPAAKSEDMVSLEEVYAALEHNWTGKEAPKPPPEPGPKVKEPPKDQPVASLVRVLMVKTDTTDDAGSNCVLVYLPAAKVNEKDPVVKYVGERLDGPHTNIIVHAIQGIEVEFAFDDEAREHEVLFPQEFTGRAMIGMADGTKPVPQAGPRAFPAAPSSRPAERTQLVGPGVYKVGTQDAEYFGVHYDEILSQVRSNRWRDPTTGKFAGIHLSEVPPGSFAAAHGAMDGDIVKSINGHAVSSVQEAITFAKNNADFYDRWEIEVENKGRTRIVVYVPPK